MSEWGRQAPQAGSSGAREGLAFPDPSRLPVLGRARRPLGYWGCLLAVCSPLSPSSPPPPGAQIQQLLSNRPQAAREHESRSRGLQQGSRASVSKPPSNPAEPHRSMPSSSRKFSLSSGC